MRADAGWLAVRDVREVDGRRVDDRSRIDELLSAPRSRVRSAAFALATEQARYNLGAIYRTINVPTLPLQFLLPDWQPRFRFRLAGSAVSAVGGAIAVGYEERERPTIIRTPSGRNVVSRGTVWIDPEHGRVVKTELITTEPRGLRAVITVIYRHEPRLDLWVPASMHESYVTAEEEISATGTYSNYRRFETGARIVR